MLGSIIHQPLVDLVGNHHQVVLLDNGGQLLEHILLQHAAGGVVGGDDDHGPGPGGDLRPDLPEIHLIAVLLFQAVGDGPGPQQVGHIDVVEPHRVGHQDLVPLIQQGGQHGEHRLGQSHGDQHLRGLVVDVVLPLELVGDGLTQLHHAEVGGVVDLPLGQGLVGRLFDVLRGVEVGAADLKVEHPLPRPLHGQGLLVYLPDARGGHPVHPGCNVIVHTHSASFPDACAQI